VELLLTRVGRDDDPGERTACENLAGLLDYLPLALEQAAAYVSQQGDHFRFMDYIRLYHQATIDLLNEGALGSCEYPDSVALTWLPTIRKMGPVARAILRISSFLESASIPLSLLLTGSRFIMNRAVRFGECAPMTDLNRLELLFRKEIARLKAYSLIQWDGAVIGLHPLLATVEYYAETDQERPETWRDCAGLLAAAAPQPSWQEDCRSGWSVANDRLWTQLLTHIVKLEQPMPDGTTPHLTPDFELLSIHAHASRENFSEALERCRALAEKLPDPETQDSFSLRVSEVFAYLLKRNLLFQEGLDQFTRLHGILTGVCGEEAPDTLRIRHNIACLLRFVESLDEAETVMNEVLESRKRVLGEDHYDTITSLHDLGWLYNAKKENRSRAEALFRHGLDRWKVTLGIENPDTRTAASNLANYYYQEKDYPQAEAVQRELLAGTIKALGEDHLECCEQKHNLALYVYNRGGHEESQRILEEVIQGYKRFYPPHHLQMQRVLTDLATVRKELGDIDGAEALHLTAIEGSLQASTEPSESIALAWSNLGYLLSSSDKHDRALPYYQKSLDAYLKSLGEMHERTFTAYMLVGNTLWGLKEFRQAEPLFLRMMEMRREALPPEDSRRILAINNYAILLGILDRNGEAEPLFREVLDLRMQVLSEDDPETIQAMSNLGQALEDLKKYDEAEDLYRRRIAVSTRVKGEDHPETLRALFSLINLLEKVHSDDEAGELRKRRVDLFRVTDETEPQIIRELALDAYRIDRIDYAEELLNRLVEMDFDLTGTHQHLARLCLLRDRSDDARRHVESGEVTLPTARSYIKIRQWWFWLLFEMLDHPEFDLSGNTARYLLGQIKAASRKEFPFMMWTMEPVLEHLQSRLAPDHLILLTALMLATHDASGLAMMDEQPAWKSAEASD